jgi:RNA polymerase sigma-70 factor, ECF subfamily
LLSEPLPVLGGRDEGPDHLGPREVAAELFELREPELINTSNGFFPGRGLMTPATHEVTKLLKAWGGGDQSALDRLMPLVYDELRRLARQHMRREKPGHLLQTSALVNEAYLRLVDASRVRWQNRAHFFGIAARLMRRILVDDARQRRREKRGGQMIQVPLDEVSGAPQEQAANLLALDDALKTLAAIDPRQGEIVELRFFGGMSIEEAAVKALAINDALGEAHFSLAVVKTWYDWDWRGGEREFKRAIELNPEFADAESHGMYAFLLDGMGRFDEAVAEARRAHNPPVTWLAGRFLYHAQRYDEAIEEFRNVLGNDPNSVQAHLGLGEVYVRQGRYGEAIAEIIKARPLVKSPRHLARIGAVYAAAGKRDEAIKILEEVKKLTDERYDLGTHIAAVYAALGDKDQAFAWLGDAYEAHNFELVELKVNPMFDALRSDPRYVEMLGRMHLAP